MGNLLHFFRAGGFVMWPLLGLSIAAVAVIVERALAYRTIGDPAVGLLSKALIAALTGDFDAPLLEAQELACVRSWRTGTCPSRASSAAFRRRARSGS